jgi:hypothetical protein
MSWSAEFPQTKIPPSKALEAGPKSGIFDAVPETGIEPAQRCRYQILSLARLPVPPFGLKAGCKDKI